MPLYEYECGACGHRFEAIQKFSDSPITECPACHGTLRKLQSAPAFQLKGTGWYATDYPKPGQPPAEKDSGGSTDSASGDKGSSKDDKSEKAEKSDKAEKTGATEKKTSSEKTDKPASSTGSSASPDASKTSAKDS